MSVAMDAATIGSDESYTVLRLVIKMGNEGAAEPGYGP